MPQKPKYVIFTSEDKENQKDRPDPHNLANIIHPARVLLSGPPSCGKSCTIKNFLIHQHPPFDKIVILHLDPNTSEYRDVDCILLDKVPPINEFMNVFDRNHRNCIIVEDLPFKSLKPVERTSLDRTLGYVSSHLNTTVLCSCQDPFSSPPSMRRMCNILILWKQPDMRCLYTIAKQMEIDKETIQYIFNNICKNRYDSLMIDNSQSGPKLRKNIFQSIVFDSDVDTDTDNDA